MPIKQVIQIKIINERKKDAKNTVIKNNKLVLASWLCQIYITDWFLENYT